MLHSLFDWAFVTNQGLSCPDQSWTQIASLCSECVYVFSLCPPAHVDLPLFDVVSEKARASTPQQEKKGLL